MRALLAAAACVGLTVVGAVFSASAPDAWAEEPARDDAVAERSANMIHGLAVSPGGDNAEAQYVLVGMAVQGHAPSQFRLGVMYREGTAVFREPALAVKWFGRAAAQGHRDALAHLAMMADEGDGAAHRTLGALYRDGRGLAQDRAAAAARFRAAAALGDVPALFALARLMRDDAEGSPADARITRVLRHVAADGMAAVLRSDKAATAPWLATAAERTRAALDGAEADASALEGLARYWLGLMHLWGVGVLVDTAAALDHHCAAAADGLDLAAHSLGLLYLEGRGVPRDLARAERWLAEAAAAGHGPAAARLSALALEATPDGASAAACGARG